jgi:hypothetical protein
VGRDRAPPRRRRRSGRGSDLAGPPPAAPPGAVDAITSAAVTPCPNASAKRKERRGRHPRRPRLGEFTGPLRFERSSGTEVPPPVRRRARAAARNPRARSPAARCSTAAS